MNTLFQKIKIIDATRVFSWPFASRYFSDYGAEVIKIESTENFDESRKFAPLKNEVSGYFEVLNRWKKSITLNLKNEKDLSIFYGLIQESDIFLENFSPNVKKKLKIDYATLSTINPKLIYGSLNAYWENMDKKAYDVIIQAESGFASLSGETQPMKNATAIIDAFSGLSLSLWITSLLYAREITGKWDWVNIPMMACGIQLLEQNLIQSSMIWFNPVLTWNHDNAIFPFWFFKVCDGEIALAIGNDHLWQKFTQHIVPELFWKYNSNQERLENKNDLISIIEKTFLKYSKIQLQKKLTDIWIPCGKINTMQDILEDNYFYEEKYIKKMYHEQLWEIVVPFEFIKYWSYTMESLQPSPSLWKHNSDYHIKQ